LTLLITLGLLTISTSAFEVTWDDGSTVHTVFQDMMEGDVGTDMSAQIGTWGFPGGGVTQYTDLDLSGTGAGPAAAATGTTYIERARSGGVAGTTNASGNEALFDLSQNSGNPFTTGTLHARFAYWMPEVANDGPGNFNSIGIWDNNPGVNSPTVDGAAYILTKSSNSVTTFSDDVREVTVGGADPWDTGANILVGQWNLIDMILDLDAPTMEVLINNVSSGAYTVPSSKEISRLHWRAEGPGRHHFIDSATQPVTPDPPTIFTWNGSTPGDWNSSSNWVTNTVSGSPGGANGNDHSVAFGALGSQGTVTTESTVTVNSVTFDNAASYTVAGLGQLNLAANSVATNPAINVSQGSHQLQLNVQLDNDTTVTVATGRTLDFNNLLNFNGNTLIKQGDGTLSLNNALAGGGSVDCQAGTCNGAGTVGDLINSGGVVAPGSSTAAAASAVPEPGSLLLLVLAVGTVCGWHRRYGF